MINICKDFKCPYAFDGRLNRCRKFPIPSKCPVFQQKNILTIDNRFLFISEKYATNSKKRVIEVVLADFLENEGEYV